MRAGVVLLVMLALAAPAAAATRDPRVPALQKQLIQTRGEVAALQGRVTQLETQLTALTGQVTQAAGQISSLGTAMTANTNYDVCLTAVNFDVFHLIEKNLAVLDGQTAPVTTPLDDKGACAAVGVTRQPASADAWVAAMNRGVAAFGLYTSWLARSR